MEGISEKVVRLIRDDESGKLRKYIIETLKKVKFSKVLSIAAALVSDNPKAIKVLFEKGVEEEEEEEEEEKERDIVNILYDNHFLNAKLLNYIIRKGFEITPKLVLQFIKNNEGELVKVVFENYIFNNDFILKLLLYYRNRTTVTAEALNDVISKELNKISANEKDEDGNTFLIHACFNKNKDIVRYLIRYGADVNLKGSHHCTPLAVAVDYNLLNEDTFYKAGYESVVKDLIDHGAHVNEKGNSYIDYENDCDLPLIIAINSDVVNENVIRYLVEHGADVNGEGHNSGGGGSGGCSPLIIACDKRYETLVKYLVEKGAEVNKEGCTYHGNSGTPLTISCQRKQEKIVKCLVDHGADVNQEDVHGVLPLVEACSSGNEAIVKYLIDHGANVNQFDKNGFMPLFTAIKRGHQAITCDLLRHHAKVDQEISNIYYTTVNTPLLLACNNGNEELAKLLVDYGADVNKKGGNGDTPLLMACRGGNKEIIMYLVEHGADIDMNGNGDTPLTMLSRNGNEAMVKYLVEAGADINKGDSDGDTPLMNACSRGHQNIIRYLVASGADIYQQNNKGKTALILSNQTIKDFILNEFTKLTN
jgi:ankyrin repeat protein